VYTVKARLA